MTTQSESKGYCVYKHTFPNGKVYIGVTCQNPSLRWRRDGSGYRPHGKSKNIKVWNAIQKYGWENVQHDILFCGLSKEDAEQEEIKLIAAYQSTDDIYGYNTASGGNITSPNAQTRHKISQAHMGKNYGKFGENAPMYGKHHTPEARKKISIATTGANNPMYGVHPSKEMREHLRNKHRDICKQVIQEDKGGNMLNIFPSIHCASSETGVNRTSISFCMRGVYKTAGGFVWKQKICN